MDWFLYDKDLRHERVNMYMTTDTKPVLNLFQTRSKKFIWLLILSMSDFDYTDFDKVIFWFIVVLSYIRHNCWCKKPHLSREFEALDN